MGFPRRTAQSAFVRWLALGLLPGVVGAIACGASAVPPSAAPLGPRSTVPPQLAPDRVQVVDEPERPLLQLVRRSGDPHGAVALAAFPDGGSRGAAALGALLHARVRAAGISRVQFQPHAYGVVLAVAAETPEAGAKALRALRAALAEPVGPNDPALPTVRDWVQRVERRAYASPAGSCASELGSDKGVHPQETFTSELLEAWRQSAFASRRLGLAALGREELLREIRAAHDETWPEGSAPLDSWPESDQVHLVDDSAERSLRIAWYLPRPTEALAVARAVSDAQHPLRHRLAALGPWRITSANATVRPKGACLRIDLGREGGAQRPGAADLAEATAVVSVEVERALRAAPGSEEHERSLLAPSDPLVAAALAAWSAVRSPEPAGPLRRVVEYAAPATEKRPTPRALSDQIERTLTSWHQRKLPFRVQVEDGQAETWLLVASPCGTRGEPAQDAGTLALAVQSLARGFQGTWGVTFEPWATPEGVGLLAHAPRRSGETPQAQAERIARAVGRALAGDPLDGRAVADARSTLLDRLGADTGWWLALETLSGDFPSALEPFGTWKSVSTASTSGVERARAALAQGPLKLAILADHNATQGEAAAVALADWLAPFRDESAVCPKPAPKAPAPGVWTLETIDEEVREGAYLSVWAPGPRELGQATAYLLNRPGGWLDKALTRPGLVSHARAHWFGGGASGGLVLEIGAEPSQLDAAVQQARALLDRLARGAAESSDATAARAEQLRQESAVAVTPRGRIVHLWQERDPLPVSLEPLRELHKAFAADKHLVVRVKRRQ